MKKLLVLFAIAIALVFSGVASASEHVYVVKKGDSLWKISKMFNADWKEIAKFNGIENPDMIYPGQEIFINGDNFVEEENFLVKKYSGKRDPFQQLVYPKPEKLIVKQSASKKAIGIVFLNGIENPKIYTDSEIGDDPWKGDVSDLLVALGYPKDKADDLERKVKIGNSDDFGHIRSGDAFWMGSGKNKVGYYTMSLKDKERLIATKIYTIEGYSVAINLWCGNPVIKPKLPEKEIPVQSAVEITAIPAVPTVPEAPKPTEIAPPSIPLEIPAPSCPGELEITSGGTYWWNDAGDHDETQGKNFFAEFMYWNNFSDACDSEYWWGLGALGSYYRYFNNSHTAKGDGWLAAGEVGIKRIHENDNGLLRMYQIKGRLGWEESDWENPKTKKDVHQEGPGYGIYTEYVHQLTGRWSLIGQAEFWDGFNQNIDGPDEWNLHPESRFRAMSFLGAEYRINEKFSARAGTGPFYQGWDDETGLQSIAKLYYNLPRDYGRISLGPFHQWYGDVPATIGLTVLYETGNLMDNIYGDHRKSTGRQVGTGVGGNQLININNPE